MFEPAKPFYMTRAVADELSAEHQQFIVQYILEHQEQLTDYLQIFEFYVDDGKQWLVQRQEQPERETTVFVELQEAKPIVRKVWVISEGNHRILLFPEDY